MDHTLSSHAAALSALGHDARLTIFRLLVRAGAPGLNVGDLCHETGLAASTLAHHLRTLVAAGLVLQERDGREVINTVDFDAVRRTLGFLTSECCTGVTLSVREDAA
ncbi:MAG: metalloregulator ArsR/SmtB family transcription factor [Proteobacteria bacterium]|nr:metalloregulator ArsR/SmtB family transcription factor [Pseudomonadota bacterium]